jgi:hypothetical protein
MGCFRRFVNELEHKELLQLGCRYTSNYTSTKGSHPTLAKLDHVLCTLD